MVKKTTNYDLHDTVSERDMTLEQRTRRVMKRVLAIQGFQRGLESPRVRSYKGYHSAEINEPATKVDKDGWCRRAFTTEEIKLMWLAYCDLKRYFGGNFKEMAKATGYAVHTCYLWSRKGRVSAPAAHKIGLDPTIPFTREQIRPDITAEGWRRFEADHGA